MPVCQAISAKGAACKGKARGGSKFCFLHDASSPKNHSQQKGRRQRPSINETVLPPDGFDLTDPEHIFKMIGFTANRVLRGEIDPKISYAVGYIAHCALRSLEGAMRAASEEESNAPPRKLALIIGDYKYDAAVESPSGGAGDPKEGVASDAS